MSNVLLFIFVKKLKTLLRLLVLEVTLNAKCYNLKQIVAY